MRAVRTRGSRTASPFSVIAAGCMLAGCDGNPTLTNPLPSAGNAASPTSPVSTAPTTGTGTLTVSVADNEGRPLANASVGVYNRTQERLASRPGCSTPHSNGSANDRSARSTAARDISHAFGEHFTSIVDVAQNAGTFLPVTLQGARRPRPTVALLPAAITQGSVSADRSELTLEITVVASQKRPSFRPDTPRVVRGGVAIARIGSRAMGTMGREALTVWLDHVRAVPTCGPWKRTGYASFNDGVQLRPRRPCAAVHGGRARPERDAGTGR